MKNTSKRVILSIVTLVLVVVALGTTTFAWFTLSGQATTSDITGTVQAGEGLEIGLTLLESETPANYRTNLTGPDWTTEIGLELASFRFGAVSTLDGKDFYNLGSVGSVLTKQVLPIDANNKGGYLEFYVHFKSNSGGIVNWTNYNFKDIADGTIREFTPTKAYQQVLNPDGLTLNSIQVASSNAARIAIYNGSSATPVKIVQKGEDTTNLNTIMGATAVLHGQYSYLTEKGNKIFWSNNVLEDIAEIDEASVLSVNLANAATSVNDLVATLVTDGADNFIAKAKVRVWLEGWDADAYDAIFQLGLNFGLTFDKVQLP